MMTCCIMGLGNSFLLLILPCICPIFFPSILWRMTIFIKDFSTTMHTRMLIFDMQIDDDLFYHGIENHPSPAYFSCICPFFFPSLLWIMRFFITDFSATIQAGIIIFAILVHSCCTMGLRVSLLQLILPCRIFISGLLFLPSIFVHINRFLSNCVKQMVYCLSCEAEARHMYWFSGVVVVVVVGSGVNF